LINNEKYILLRMCSWDAIHDIGHSGFNFKNEKDFKTFLSELEKYAKILISFEEKHHQPLEIMK